MTVKVFISGLSGNKEVKKRQQRVLMILDSKSIDYTVIDITEPGKESDKEFMQQNSKTADSESKSNPLPPQIFNEEDYCGDYDGFDLANEMDELEQFLKLPLGSLGQTISENGVSNGVSRETSADKETKDDSITNTEEDNENTTIENETLDNNPVDNIEEIVESNLINQQESDDIIEENVTEQQNEPVDAEEIEKEENEEEEDDDEEEE